LVVSSELTSPLIERADDVIGHKSRGGATASCRSRLWGLCVFSLMPPYGLKADLVNWEMRIVSGKTCTKGLNYSTVAISNVKLTAPA
jgi:hypothetical protein